MSFSFCGLSGLLWLASVALVAPPALAVDADTPVGRWQTFDESGNAPRGIVRIFEQDGKLFGRIERPNKADRDVCAACTDERRGQPLDGLVIIRNMQRSSDDPFEWAGGDVLDPDSGRLYRFKMRIEERGAKLVVRGFLGLSLLGRSQTWKRVL